MWQEGILLELIETVKLVDEKDDPLAAGLLDHFLDFFHAYRHRGEGYVGKFHDPSDEPADRCLADPAWPPEYERWHIAAFYQDPQHFSFPEEMLLSYDIVERPRTHPVGERFLFHFLDQCIVRKKLHLILFSLL